jgi:hypothetical protein
MRSSRTTFGLAMCVTARMLGCSNGAAPGAPLTPGKSAMTDPISLSCSTSTTGDTVTLHLEAINRSDRVVHVLTSKRLPYVLFEGGRAMVLCGVNDPDPDIDYYGIEIPPSRPLAPGERLTADAAIVPLVPHHHYGGQEAPVALPAELEVVCKLAYGDAPLEAQVINGLLAWQHWVTAAPLRVKTTPR